MAAAALALLGLSASESFALSLGRITVQSALGEPLKAEIEVPNISAEEAASLKANVASPAAFVAAGLDYNAAMSGLQATLARRADGRSYIRLSSDRPINDPFVDMILEASWSSGRIVRDYTMLFDPPSLKQSAPVPTLAQTSTSVPVTPPLVPPAPPSAKVNAAPAAPVTDTARANVSKPVATPPASKAASKPESSASQQVVVQTGDSASKIAMRAKSSDVSLDQMLVALLRSNPDAFSKGNLNRLRAGAVLDLPSSDQAKSVSAAQASQTVIAQSKDFNEFRRNLADSAPKVAVEAADRKSAGKVEAKVEDKKPASTAADKLTLSKGALQPKLDEAKLAKERADKDAATRAAELAKNIADLNKLSASSAQKPAPAPAPAAAASAAKPALPAAPAVEVAKATPAPLAAPTASAVAAAPTAPVSAASAAAAPKTAPVVAAAEEPGLIDQLMEDPALPLAGGGLIALLGGFALYRRQQAKKRSAHVDSSFLESRLQPDSFFGASGGQRVDTAQNGAGALSSMAYTNSQLNAADDVDPVAEADVYLAYGRDMQAEEILKEALRHNPGRLAIHTKLLDIYAKRRDAGNFLSSAQNAFQLVGGDSPEWAQICEQGLSIDPENPLYQPGGASASGFASLEQPPVTVAIGDNTQPTSAVAEMPHAGTDLDLDLDFSAEDEANSGMQELRAESPSEPDKEETVKLNAQEEFESNGLDFDISAPVELDTAQATLMGAEITPDLPDLSFSMDGFNMEPPAELPAAPEPDPAPVPALTLPDFESTGPHAPEPTELEAGEPEEEPAKANDGMLEFDLSSLSLDLGPGTSTATDEDGLTSGDNSLVTKLALAEEFVSIGDHDGARALIEEVVLEATGELREKAQRALANLS
jgi:pilus assembly protein FimV